MHLSDVPSGCRRRLLTGACRDSGRSNTGNLSCTQPTYRSAAPAKSRRLHPDSPGISCSQRAFGVRQTDRYIFPYKGVDEPHPGLAVVRAVAETGVAYRRIQQRVLTHAFECRNENVNCDVLIETRPCRSRLLAGAYRDRGSSPRTRRKPTCGRPRPAEAGAYSHLSHFADCHIQFRRTDAELNNVSGENTVQGPIHGDPYLA